MVRGEVLARDCQLIFMDKMLIVGIVARRELLSMIIVTLRGSRCGREEADSRGGDS